MESWVQLTSFFISMSELTLFKLWNDQMKLSSSLEQASLGKDPATCINLSITLLKSTSFLS
jgi:hypothetical protein